MAHRKKCVCVSVCAHPPCVGSTHGRMVHSPQPCACRPPTLPSNKLPCGQIWFNFLCPLKGNETSGGDLRESVHGAMSDGSYLRNSELQLRASSRAGGGERFCSGGGQPDRVHRVHRVHRRDMFNCSLGGDVGVRVPGSSCRTCARVYTWVQGVLVHTGVVCK